ncbi:MAG: glycoside hydrolase family 2 TIM barrel-domain containing protein [Clostridia bacterium]
MKNLDKIEGGYPRPQLVRQSFLSLDGLWQYSITNSKDFPTNYDGQIIVPFSPEAKLSGVEKVVMPQDYLHYNLDFEIKRGFNKGRILLHFGAVDSICDCFINGNFVGNHVGGYTPFSYDITEFVAAGQNNIKLIVKDYTDTSYHTRGKQRIKRGGIWYSMQSGIWQTVWIESVERNYISSLKVVPDYDNSKVVITVESVGKLTNLNALVSFEGEEVAVCEFEGDTATIQLDNFHAWDTTCPDLYDLLVICDTDAVTSYFGMRKFSIEKDKYGYKRFFLNNKVVFLNGLLDQGYNQLGLLTPPNQELMQQDILTAKKMGFNMLRKHIKIEPLKWYYYCDLLGMLVWQDMINGGSKYSKSTTMYLPFFNIKIKDNQYKRFGRSDDASRTQFYKEYKEMLTYLQNVVSLCVWTPFNEGWGQFDSVEVTAYTKQVDPTRLVDSASGWHDQGAGDFASQHIYFKKVPIIKDNRAIALTEFGGYSYAVPDHIFNVGKTFGYKKFKDKDKLFNAYVKLYSSQVIPYISKGLSVAIYTQLTDVEDEVNGLITYDRLVCKFDIDRIKEFNERIKID